MKGWLGGTHYVFDISSLFCTSYTYGCGDQVTDQTLVPSLLEMSIHLFGH